MIDNILFLNRIYAPAIPKEPRIILADLNPSSDMIPAQAGVLGDLPGNEPVRTNQPVNHRASLYGTKIFVIKIIYIF